MFTAAFALLADAGAVPPKVISIPPTMSNEAATSRR
jgi:hypothetical protein